MAVVTSLIKQIICQGLVPLPMMMSVGHPFSSVVVRLLVTVNMSRMSQSDDEPILFKLFSFQ